MTVQQQLQKSQQLIMDQQSRPRIPQFNVGLYTEQTPLGAGMAQRWKDGNNVRFHNGLPQSLGGWIGQGLTQRDAVTGLIGPINGIARNIHEWTDLEGNEWIAVGTNSKLYVIDSQANIWDITPIQQQDNLDDAMSTTSGSVLVTIYDPAYTPDAGDFVSFSTSTTIGGNIVINGQYEVNSVLGPYTYTINAGVAADEDDADGGGPVQVTYYLPSGLADNGFWYGWGVGGWGNGTWGTPRGYGQINTLGAITGGTGYDGGGSDTFNAVALTGGSGSGATAGIVVTDGVVTAVTIVSPGSGYVVGDALSASAADLGNDGGSGFSVTVGSVITSSMPRPLTIWSLCNFGEDLLASPNGGSVYFWEKAIGPSSPAVSVPTAPVYNQRILVAPQAQQLICLGAQLNIPYGSPSPMNVFTSSDGDFTDFTATASNEVYQNILTYGSRILTGDFVQGGIFIHTDKGQYLMQATGDQLIYNVQQVGGVNPIVGPNAGCTVNGVGYWMSKDKFMTYNGIVQELPCDVWTAIFDTNAPAEGLGFGINYAQAQKIFCSYNDAFGEIWWDFPSVDSDECDSYVAFNPTQGYWIYGTRSRTCATRITSIQYGYPLAVDNIGNLYTHEDGITANGVPLTGYLESGDFEMGQFDTGTMQTISGDLQYFVYKVVPDNKYLTGRLSMYLKTLRRSNQGDGYWIKGPYYIENGAQSGNSGAGAAYGEIGVRVRGRQMAIRFEFGYDGEETAWRLGNYAYYILTNGRR